MEKVTLSSEARRKLGGNYVPRQRHPDEAQPPSNDLFARPLLKVADCGSAPFIRRGAGDALRVPSRGTC